MSTLKGIFSASMSILNEDLTLDVNSTIEHAKNVDKLGAGPAFLGSNSQAQLISVQEKKDLIKELEKHKFDHGVLIGTGCNSLKENINLMRYSLEKGFSNFLLMNPAYYKNDDDGVYDFYSNIFKKVPECKVVFYNFNTLSGYTFSPDIIKRLVNEFGSNCAGLKDSTGNLWNNLKIANFSIFVGSEAKLLTALTSGCAGCISGTTNVTHSLARKVYNDFQNDKEQTVNEQLVAVRNTFDGYDLISALHSFMSVVDIKYAKVLPPLKLLSTENQQKLLNKLKKLNFVPSRNNAV